MFTLMRLCLQGIDGRFLQFTITKTLERSASVHLLFAFEYVIQSSIIVSTFVKYLLSAFDAYMEGRWENKVCTCYIQLTLAAVAVLAANSVLSPHLCFAHGTLCMSSERQACLAALQGVYVFYLQLLTDMLHLCVYLVFFVIVFTNYGLPLHLVSFVNNLRTSPRPAEACGVLAVSVVLLFCAGSGTGSLLDIPELQKQGG